MQPLGGSEDPTSTSVHTLQLAGILAGGAGKALVRCRMTYTTAQGVTLELSVRAEKEGACSLVVSAIGG
jgi:coatomer subunit gamma